MSMLLLEGLADVFQDVAQGKYKDFDGLIKDLVNVRTKAIKDKLSLNIFKPNTDQAMTNGHDTKNMRRAALLGALGLIFDSI